MNLLRIGDKAINLDHAFQIIDNRKNNRSVIVYFSTNRMEASFEGKEADLLWAWLQEHSSDGAARK